MQDRYVGDVGDFGKYGLLNEICKKSNGGVRLGINWFYVTREEKQRGEGRYISYRYLSDESKDSRKYAVCFPDLYDKLKAIVNGRRSIKEIEKGLILPKETIFYSNPLPLLPQKNPFEREEHRKNWLEESLSRLKSADIIFLDPDNGIQTDKVRKTQIKAIKYVFKDEIKKYYERGKSLIIYNHRDRKPKPEYDRKITDSLGQIKSLNGIKVLRFKRVSVRDFIFLIQKDHQDLMDQAIDYLRSEPCDFLFEIYNLDWEK
jgi:hypothetical protein